MKKLSISPITGEIFYANVKDLGDGNYKVIGEQENVTDDVLSMAYQWFEHKYREEGSKNPYVISIKGKPYSLVFDKTNKFNFEEE